MKNWLTNDNVRLTTTRGQAHLDLIAACAAFASRQTDTTYQQLTAALAAAHAHKLY